MAVVGTFIYMATIDEASKRAMHTAVFILTALLAATGATRYTDRRLHFFFLNTKALFECSQIRIFHPNPLQHMWIEVNSTTSKQGLSELKVSD